MDNIEKIIFVYNADSGVLSTVSDFAHKILSPETYSCNLCNLTYGNLAMKNEWKSFLQSLDCGTEFLHRNQFEEKYPQFKETDLPCVLGSAKNQLKLILTAEEINAMKDVDTLKDRLTQKLNV